MGKWSEDILPKKTDEWKLNTRKVTKSFLTRELQMKITIEVLLHTYLVYLKSKTCVPMADEIVAQQQLFNAGSKTEW